MARKLVKNNSWGITPPPLNKSVGPKMKKIKVAQNCLKWRENWSKMIFGLFSKCVQMFTNSHLNVHKFVLVSIYRSTVCSFH